MKALKLHSKSFLEFLFLWAASLSPILLGVLFVKMNTLDVNYFQTIYSIFIVNPIFPYIATMVAPFLYYVMVNISSKEDRRVARYGWLFLIFAILVLLVSVFDVSDIIESNQSSSKPLQPFRETVMLASYVAALLVLYYSIYLNRLEAPDLEESNKKRVNEMLDVVDEVLGESE